VVQQPRDGEPLLLAAAEHVFPLLARVPAALALGEVAEPGLVERTLEVVLRLALVAHVALTVGVDDLVTQCADAEVRSLGQEHDAVLAVVLGPADQAAVDGPEAGDDAGDGALAYAVGPRDLGETG